MGKNVRIVNGDATPPNIAFIDPDRRIEQIGEDVQIDQLTDRDVMMILDTSAWAQLGPMGDVLKTTKALRSSSITTRARTIWGLNPSKTRQPRPPADWLWMRLTSWELR